MDGGLNYDKHDKSANSKEKGFQAQLLGTELGLAKSVTAKLGVAGRVVNEIRGRKKPDYIGPCRP